jgi:hypothetical protein
MFRTTLGISLALVVSTSALATDLSLEPCIDGGVSASGNFPTQAMEEQIAAYRNWASDMPGYLFAFELDVITPPAEEAAVASDVQ